MPLLRKPLYQRSEGADEDRWRLVFDTDASRLFVEHEKTRGDMRGSGYGTDIDELDVATFLRTPARASTSLCGCSGPCLRTARMPRGPEGGPAGHASTICELLQARSKGQASVSHQGGAEHLGLIAGKRPRKPARNFLSGE
jgi:hypothetical protein